MTKIESLIERAKKNPKRIVLPETNDERIQKAAKRVTSEKIAELVWIDTPAKYPRIDEIAQKYYELKKHKGITEAEAKETVLNDSLCFGFMMTRLGIADGIVAGASHTTKDVVRAAIKCLDMDRSLGVVSGAFLMELSGSPYGASGLFIFSDCAVIPIPSAKQLARIAISSGDLLKQLFGIQPKIAFLTYSSKGSAEGESVDRAREAAEKVKEKRPDFLVDGELQFDAAIVPEAAKRKAPDSPLAGEANVLIFPSLDAGNITYKAVERLGGVKAVGPSLLGFTKPVSDLSRGSSVDDIVNAIALTVVRAQLGV